MPLATEQEEWHTCNLLRRADELRTCENRGSHPVQYRRRYWASSSPVRLTPSPEERAAYLLLLVGVLCQKVHNEGQGGGRGLKAGDQEQQAVGQQGVVVDG